MDDRLENIQILRFLAAFIVLLSHLDTELYSGLDRLDAGLDISLVGQFGVDIFFIISGFIMVYISFNAPGGAATAAGFLRKRIARVVPLYWLFSIVTVLVIVLRPDLKNITFFDFEYFLKSMMFLPHDRGDGDISPVYGLGWTLNYELFFYCLFAFTLFFSPGWRMVLFTSTILIISLFGFVYEFDSVFLEFWSRSIILEFLYGCGIAYLFKKQIYLNLAASIWLLIASLSLLYLSTLGSVLPNDSYWRGIVWGMPAALLVSSVVLSRHDLFVFAGPRIKSLFVRLGDGSYSLYLVHMFVIRGVSIILSKIENLYLHDAIHVVLTILLSIIISDLLYRYFEIPVTRYVSSVLSTSRQVNSVVTCSARAD